MPEKYHGWTISHETMANGKYLVKAQGPRSGDISVQRSAEVDDTMGAETLVTRLKYEIAMMEFQRNTGTAQREWAPRLARAARENEEHRISRRLAAAAQVESDEEIVHRLTGAKVKISGRGN